MLLVLGFICEEETCYCVALLGDRLVELGEQHDELCYVDIVRLDLVVEPVWSISVEDYVGGQLH